MRTWGRLVEVCGWLVLAPLLAVGLARIFAWDSRTIFVGLNALTAFVYLPAWPVAVAAGIVRSWVLCAVAVLVVLAQLYFVLPELLASEPVSAAARSAPRIRIFDANVYEHNSNWTAYAAEIQRTHPDIVVLQEATPPFLEGLDRSGALAAMPYRITVPRSDPAAAAVMSRWPLTEDDVVSVRDRPLMIRATLEIRGRRFRLFAVHTVSPFAQRAGWIEDLDAVRAAVVAEHRPVVLAGDFNATWGHRHFRELLDVGVTDAAAARGHPWQMTWPDDRRIVPVLARIDHVMTTEGVETVNIETARGPGSDHRPLVADVAVVAEP